MKLMPYVTAAACLFCVAGHAALLPSSTAPERLLIWPGAEAPGAAGSTAKPVLTERSHDPQLPDRAWSGIRAPTITVYPAAHPNGTAMLVIPGGAYKRVVVDKEGTDLAPVFNQQGYTLFVMNYRLPGDGHREGADAPLADAQRAMRLIRKHSAQWGVRPDKLGVMGFSAGGHVAASLGTGFDRVVYPPLDALDRLSARPDFMILMYPVMTMTPPLAHAGSRHELLGASPDAQREMRYSPQRQVTANTPPALLIQAVDDPSVNMDNALMMFASLRRQHIPAELHLFEQGKHGFGIRGARGLPVAIWPQLVDRWIAALPPTKPATH